jgi:hypothetical protein
VPEDSQSPTKHLVHLLLSEGWTVSEIAGHLGLARSTVCFHKRTLGVALDRRYARRYDWEEIRAYYDAGHTMSACKEAFGFSNGAWNDAIVAATSWPGRTGGRLTRSSLPGSGGTAHT